VKHHESRVTGCYKSHKSCGFEKFLKEFKFAFCFEHPKGRKFSALESFAADHLTRGSPMPLDPAGGSAPILPL